MRFLQTEQLQIALGGRTLLDRLDWTVRRGEFWCVLGKNGVGKSSLLYALSGLLPHAAGRLLLAGEPIASLTAATLAKRRGLMLQHQADAFSHSVLDTVFIASVEPGMTPLIWTPRTPLWRGWVLAKKPAPISPVCPAANVSGWRWQAYWHKIRI